MSINIKNDPLRSAILFGRPVLFASQRIPREEVPEGWYYYELRGSVRNAKKPVALSDHAYVNPIGSVLSPVPLKRADTRSRRVNGQFLLLGETMTLRDYCRNNSLEYPLRNQTFAIRPASPEEAGIFYAMPPEEDAALSAIGHVRMDFGRSGKDFWHTWHPRGPEELNNAAFKAELQEVVDELRASVLKDYNAMTRYCESHGGKIDGGWVQNYGYIIETEGYRYCLRCNPVQGDYQAYLTIFDLNVQRQSMAHAEKPLAGRVTYANGEQQEITDSETFLQTIQEELPFRSTTGFRFETLTDDPEVKKAVDDILLDFAGEDNPRRTCNYGLTEAGKQALLDAADPSRPHTHAWFVMTDTNTPQEKIRQELTLEEAIQIYQDSDTSEKRLGVTKDGIATVDLVHFQNGEQHFFTDHEKLESFRSDPVVAEAVERLHQQFDQPDIGIRMGGI